MLTSSLDRRRLLQVLLAAVATATLAHVPAAAQELCEEPNLCFPRQACRVPIPKADKNCPPDYICCHETDPDIAWNSSKLRTPDDDDDPSDEGADDDNDPTDEGADDEDDPTDGGADVPRNPRILSRLRRPRRCRTTPRCLQKGGECRPECLPGEMESCRRCCGRRRGCKCCVLVRCRFQGKECRAVGGECVPKYENTCPDRCIREDGCDPCGKCVCCVYPPDVVT